MRWLVGTSSFIDTVASMRGITDPEKVRSSPLTPCTDPPVNCSSNGLNLEACINIESRVRVLVPRE